MQKPCQYGFRKPWKPSGNAGNRGLSISGNRAETVGNRGNGNKFKGFSGNRKPSFTVSGPEIEEGFRS